MLGQMTQPWRQMQSSDCKPEEQRWQIIIHVSVKFLRDKGQKAQNSVCFCVQVLLVDLSCMGLLLSEWKASCSGGGG